MEKDLYLKLFFYVKLNKIEEKVSIVVLIITHEISLDSLIFKSDFPF